MKFFALLSLFLLSEATLFSQQVPIQGLHLQRTNLVVRWKAPKHLWPTNLWTYQVVPTKYSPETISNLAKFFSFTEKENDFGEGAILFGRWDRLPSLRIDTIGGEIGFQTAYTVGTNHVKLISTNEAVAITTNLLAKIGIPLSELTRDKKGKPILRIVDNGYLQYEGGHRVETNTSHGADWFMEGGRWVTNATSRVVHFDRDIDGMGIWGYGGYGNISFGTNATIVGVGIQWRNLERYKCYAAATPEQIIQWIREGKATFQRERYIVTSFVPIDWSSIKSLTIKKAKAIYWSEDLMLKRIDGKSLLPSYLIPFVQILATADTGKEKFDVEIWCPLFDETRT